MMRVATRADAPAIAALFQEAYAQSSHECSEARYVAETFDGDDHLWLVVSEAGDIVAVTCVRNTRWNRSYETGYSITRASHRGRGFAKQLFLASLERAQLRDDCDLIVGYPRSRTMYQLTTTGFEAHPVVVGHDGGLNIANGRREVHLVTLARNPRRNPVRVVSRELGRAAEGLRGPILTALDFDTVVGKYPATLVVGPTGNRTARVAGCEVSYLRDPTALNGAVHVTGVTPVDPAAEPGPALLQFIDELGPVPYLALHVLADKGALIDGLCEQGFETTAWLPAWAARAGCRYDCVMLVKGRFESAPLSHGVQDVVDRLRRELAPPRRAAAAPMGSSVALA